MTSILSVLLLGYFPEPLILPTPRVPCLALASFFHPSTPSSLGLLIYIRPLLCPPLALFDSESFHLA